MVVASTLQLALEQNVRQHGRLQQVTQDGTVLSDTDASLIQPEWSPPLQHALDQWRQLPDRVPGLDLVAVYARGSIPRGLALPGLSDVDTVGLATIQEPSNPALQSWRGQSAERAAALRSAFPHVSGLDMALVAVPPSSEVGRWLGDGWETGRSPETGWWTGREPR